MQLSNWCNYNLIDTLRKKRWMSTELKMGGKKKYESSKQKFSRRHITWIWQLESQYIAYISFNKNVKYVLLPLKYSCWLGIGIHVGCHLFLLCWLNTHPRSAFLFNPGSSLNPEATHCSQAHESEIIFF